MVEYVGRSHEGVNTDAVWTEAAGGFVKVNSRYLVFL